MLAGETLDDEALLGLLSRVAEWVEAKLTGDSIDDVGDALAPMYAAAVRGRCAGGERAGKPTARLGVPTPVVELDPDRAFVGPQCVRLREFSLHAHMRCSARDREALERLCRYTARGPIAQARLFEMADGRFGMNASGLGGMGRKLLYSR